MSVSETDTAARSRWRPQFSIRVILALIATAAILIAAWKYFLWRPPTDAIIGYEKAPMYFGRTAQIGPNRIRIESVLRNDVQGKTHIEDGRGGELPNVTRPADDMIAAAPWLDCVRLDLSPGGDLVDIIEVRVFDHATRELLNRVDPAYGWSFGPPNVINVFGLGKTIPPRLDVWLRVHSYAEGAPVFRLPPKAGASVSVGEMEVTVHEIQSGFQGWSSRDGFVPVEGDFHAECTAELRWRGGTDDHYQVGVVTRDGERLFDGYVRPGSRDFGRDVLHVHCPIEEIDHFEIRHFGGKHRFFYEAVEVPSIGTPRTFSPPPTAIVNVAGRDTPTLVPEFRPLKVRVGVADGIRSQGSFGSSTFMALTPIPTGPRELGQSFSLVLDVRGIGNLPLGFRFRESSTGKWMSTTRFGSRGRFQASTGSRFIAEDHFASPISSVDQIEINIDSPP